MTRVLVQRGSSGGGSSNPNRYSGSSSARPEPQVSVPPPAPKDEESGEEVVVGDEVLEAGECDKARIEDSLVGGVTIQSEQKDGSCDDEEVVSVVESDVREEVVVKGLSGLRIEGSSGGGAAGAGGGSCPPPPPPPVPPQRTSSANLNSRRNVLGTSNSGCVGSSRRGACATARPVVSARTSPAGSLPSSPRSHNESEGYNSADEQKPCSVSSYDDFVSGCLHCTCLYISRYIVLKFIIATKLRWTRFF